MLSIYERAKSEAGDVASIFFRMLSARGGLPTAKYLINASQPSEGSTKLFELGRLDLTVEVEVVENKKWHSLLATTNSVASRLSSNEEQAAARLINFRAALNRRRPWVSTVAFAEMRKSESDCNYVGGRGYPPVTIEAA
jgi:hypothetical protein